MRREELNPQFALLDRPVPAGMRVDPIGLVESWVGAAEDWLTGVLAADALSPQEAFEGIEHLGRLRRCRPTVLNDAEGIELLQRLSAVLEAKQQSDLVPLALQFPDIDGWLQQAQEAWDGAGETLELARQLLEDIDALDFLTWYAELHGVDASDSAWQSQQAGLARCHTWLDRHAVFFAIAEPYIRAVAKTMPEDLEFDDPTGCLALSAATYVRLMDECEQAWEDYLDLPDPGLLRRQRPCGHIRMDYRIPELAHAAGAADPFQVPQPPCLWRAPSGSFQAMMYLPQVITPGEDVFLEILFGTGQDFLEPAAELVGGEVRLAGATGTIEQRIQGGALAVFARIPLQGVTSTQDSTVSLSVNGEVWL